MSELRTIVDRLNGHPFNKDLTLVTFDELSPFELLQLVNEVLTHLDDRHGVDLRDEDPSVTAARNPSCRSRAPPRCPPFA